MSSLARRAARGALWTVLGSVCGRAVGVVGTLTITRFLAPDTIGEVSDASILALTANWLTVWGFGQYAVINARGAERREVMWHSTVFYVGLGVLALALVVAFGPQLAALVSAPSAAAYIPGLALAVFIRRLGAMPERVLIQRMDFRASALSLAIGEIAYAGTAVGLAYSGAGGAAIVIGNLVQSTVVVLLLVSAAGIRSWATPVRLRASRVKDLLGFGIPLGVQGLAHNAARSWDNLAVSRYFGPGSLGVYNLAYNLADIPAVQIGEQVALVMLPWLAELPSVDRPRALERAAALLTLVVAPLSIGLAIVADPLIELLLPPGEWQEVAPLLSVLACLSIFRPLTWALATFFSTESKTGRLMALEIAKLVLLLVGFVVLAPFGLRAAALAVGISFGLTALGGVVLAARVGASVARLFGGMMRPLAACAVMAVAVWCCEGALGAGWESHPAHRLLLDVLVGAAAYVAAAHVVCREAVADFYAFVRRVR